MNEKIITREDCKQIQISILDAITDICLENDLHYSLGYGTLIGAVRHKGFIPWDDDIDIFLLRSEYNTLIRVLKNQDKYPWLSIVDDENTKGYYYPFAKAVDNRTVAKMEDNVTPHGIWVDIFPIDGIPADEKECTKHLKKCLLYRAFIIAMTTDFSSKEALKKSGIKRIFAFVGNLYGKERMLQAYKKQIVKYSAEKTGFAGCMSTPYILKERFPIELYKDYLSLPFEGRKFQVIKEYDQFLTRLYGAYMTLPPENKRTEHHITAWYKD